MAHHVPCTGHRKRSSKSRLQPHVSPYQRIRSKTFEVTSERVNGTVIYGMEEVWSSILHSSTRSEPVFVKSRSGGCRVGCLVSLNREGASIAL